VLDGATVGVVVAARVGVSVGGTGVLDGATVGVVVAAKVGVSVGAAAAVFVACGGGVLVWVAATVSVGANTGVAVGGWLLGSSSVAFAGSIDVASGDTPCDDEGRLTVTPGVGATVPAAAAWVVVVARLSAVCVAPILSSSNLTLFGK
jgi:hypothetical protein